MTETVQDEGALTGAFGATPPLVMEVDTSPTSKAHALIAKLKDEGLMDSRFVVDRVSELSERLAEVFLVRRKKNAYRMFRVVINVATENIELTQQRVAHFTVPHNSQDLFYDDSEIAILNDAIIQFLPTIPTVMRILNGVPICEKRDAAEYILKLPTYDRDGLGASGFIYYVKKVGYEVRISRGPVGSAFSQATPAAPEQSSLDALES